MQGFWAQVSTPKVFKLMAFWSISRNFEPNSTSKLAAGCSQPLGAPLDTPTRFVLDLIRSTLLWMEHLAGKKMVANHLVALKKQNTTLTIAGDLDGGRIALILINTVLHSWLIAGAQFFPQERDALFLMVP